MNEFVSELYDRAAKSFLETDAPDGIYFARSNQTCDCCGERISAISPLVVRNGKVDEESVLLVGSQLTELHPDFGILQSVVWDGGGSFTLTFREDSANNLNYFN